jgi:hypothetical protein
MEMSMKNSNILELDYGIDNVSVRVDDSDQVSLSAERAF